MLTTVRGLDPDVKMQLGESAPWLNAPLRSSAARSQKFDFLDFTLVTPRNFNIASEK